jgi:MoxR-like ATPase
MEENTTTLDIRAIKIERECIYRSSHHGNEQSYCGSKAHGRAFINWTLGQGHILLEGVPGLAKP